MGFCDGPEGVAGFHGMRAFLGDGSFGGCLAGCVFFLRGGLMRMGLRGSRFGEGGGGQDQLLADADLGRFGQAVGGGEGLPADAVLVGDAGKCVTGLDDDGALRGARLAGGAGRCGGMGGGSGLDDRSGLGGRDGLDNRRIDGGRTDRAVDDFRGCGSLAGRCDGDQLGLAAAAVREQ